MCKDKSQFSSINMIPTYCKYNNCLISNGKNIITCITVQPTSSIILFPCCFSFSFFLLIFFPFLLLIFSHLLLILPCSARQIALGSFHFLLVFIFFFPVFFSFLFILLSFFFSFVYSFLFLLLLPSLFCCNELPWGLPWLDHPISPSLSLFLQLIFSRSFSSSIFFFVFSVLKSSKIWKESS